MAEFKIGDKVVLLSRPADVSRNTWEKSGARKGHAGTIENAAPLGAGGSPARWFSTDFPMWYRVGQWWYHTEALELVVETRQLSLPFDEKVKLS